MEFAAKFSILLSVLWWQSSQVFSQSIIYVTPGNPLPIATAPTQPPQPVIPQVRPPIVSDFATEIGQACSNDNQCGQNAFCYKMPVSPRCEMGTCQCKAYFYKSSRSASACFPRINMTIGQPCNKDDLESYPRGSHCFAGVVQCRPQYEMSNFSTCVLRKTVQSEYGAPCTSDSQCNSEIGLFCNLAWQSCTCFSKYVWTGGVCEEAYYGSSCVTDDNCQMGGAYTQGGAGNGGTCSAVDHTCTCDHGFMAVNYTQFYLDNTGESVDLVRNTWTICVVENLNTVKQPLGAACTVSEWSSAMPTVDQSFCKAGLGCIICPEVAARSRNVNGTTPTGTCRNHAGFRLHSHFGIAAYLTCIYVVAYIVKLLTVLTGSV